VVDVLADVERTMEKYGLLDTAGADPEVKRNITSFQQFYVSASQKRPLYEWCARALRIRFLSELLRAIIEGKATAEEAGNEYGLAVKITQWLKVLSGERIKEVNKQLMASADQQIPHFKNLKGKPLHRVFWQVVSRNNLTKIHDLVKT